MIFRQSFIGTDFTSVSSARPACVLHPLRPLFYAPDEEQSCPLMKAASPAAGLRRRRPGGKLSASPARERKEQP